MRKRASPGLSPVESVRSSAEKPLMTVTQLDLLFPYIFFFYGVLMTLALNSERLSRIADERFPHELLEQWRAHRGLALLCLLVGAAWILQNLWLA